MTPRKSRGTCYLNNIFIKFMAILLVLITANFVQGSPQPALAVEISGSPSGMTVEPAGMLFDIGNMAPGDKVTERLTIKNHEYFSFKYTLSSSLTDESVDSEFLFNNFNLLIKEVRSDSVKYEGKLKDLKTIYFGSMLPKGQREYDCTLEFPLESGNEYQRKTTSFKFVVSAVQEESNGGNNGGGDDNSGGNNNGGDNYVGGGNPLDPKPPIVVPLDPEPASLESSLEVSPGPESPIVPSITSTTSVIIGLPDTGGNLMSHQMER